MLKMPLKIPHNTIRGVSGSLDANIHNPQGMEV